MPSNVKESNMISKSFEPHTGVRDGVTCLLLSALQHRLGRWHTMRGARQRHPCHDLLPISPIAWMTSISSTRQHRRWVKRTPDWIGIVARDRVLLGGRKVMFNWNDQNNEIQWSPTTSETQKTSRSQEYHMLTPLVVLYGHEPWDIRVKDANALFVELPKLSWCIKQILNDGARIGTLFRQYVRFPTTFAFHCLVQIHLTTIKTINKGRLWRKKETSQDLAIDRLIDSFQISFNLLGQVVPHTLHTIHWSSSCMSRNNLTVILCNIFSRTPAASSNPRNHRSHEDIPTPTSLHKYEPPNR